ncbi:MAG TPA: hypothetical protein VMR45_01605 [Patescibacteria group bacterium]|nr:hypothetical protein [Patescibacteria group bacterium]
MNQPNPNLPAIIETGPHLYLTPRAAEAALGAGILTVRPNVDNIQGIADYIDNHMTSPEYRFPCAVSELNIVMRWSGRGAVYRIPGIYDRWDTLLHEAKPDTPYLNAQTFTKDQIDSLRNGDSTAYIGVTKAGLDPNKTVEVNVRDWDSTNFDEEFALGVLWRNAGRDQKSLGDRALRNLFEAFDPESLSRSRRAREAANGVAESPSVMSMLLRIFDETKRRLRG